MGDYIKGDKVGGNKVGGDMVGGDKVTGNKGNVFEVKDSIGVGYDVQMKNVTINQQNTQTSDIDLQMLAQELEKLRQELKKIAADAEQDIAVGVIAAAESEAKRGDKSKTFEYLSKAGKWVLEVAEKIGVPTAIEALKTAISP